MNSREEVYGLLEQKMLKYADLASVMVEPNGEPMVAIEPTDKLRVAPIDPNMAEFTGQDIYVRQGTARLLGEASIILAQSYPDLQLEVVYGYRALSIQTANFKRFEAKLQDQYQGIELREAVHRMVASPDVAGHPTGGAVDVQLVRNGNQLDMGTPIRTFVKDAYTFSPYISREGWLNRQRLGRCMVQAGFAPFDGEWWHYSYGDREWAKYYGKPSAIYEQIEFTTDRSTTANKQNKL